MTKEEFIEILKKLNIPINEGIQNDKSTGIYPRIVMFEIAWEDISASDDVYNTNVTYQISFFSNIPRNPKLIELKHILNENGIRPFINHEYIEDEKYFHSFFSVELLEEL